MAAVCLARCALQQGITPSWRRPLRSDGVPPTHWVAHQGRYHVHGGGQEDASSWGNPPDTYDNLLPAEEVIFQLSIDELGNQVANTKKFGNRYSICSKNFQITLIIMMQMTCFKKIFNFLVKVKWECATTHIPECTCYTAQGVQRLVPLCGEMSLVHQGHYHTGGGGQETCHEDASSWRQTS